MNFFKKAQATGHINLNLSMIILIKIPFSSIDRMSFQQESLPKKAHSNNNEEIHLLYVDDSYPFTKTEKIQFTM